MKVCFAGLIIGDALSAKPCACLLFMMAPKASTTVDQNVLDYFKNFLGPCGATTNVNRASEIALRQLYEHVAAEKVDNIGNLINKYKGQMPELLAAVCAKYNMNVAAVEELFNQKSNSATNEHGHTPLHNACSDGNYKMVSELLSSTGLAMVGVQNNKGNTALHFAASRGDLNNVKAWRSNNNKTASKNSNEQTQITKRDAAIVTARANLNLVNIKGKTALDVAVRCNKVSFSIQITSCIVIQMYMLTHAYAQQRVCLYSRILCVLILHADVPLRLYDVMLVCSNACVLV